MLVSHKESRIDLVNAGSKTKLKMSSRNDSKDGNLVGRTWGLSYARSLHWRAAELRRRKRDRFSLVQTLVMNLEIMKAIYPRWKKQTKVCAWALNFASFQEVSTMLNSGLEE